ncbi:hypothetical protein Slin14017_G096670 [Septoria linicola]|nr:hypothetical protein Slin14017_G096670 [Septoria linicola]
MTGRSSGISKDKRRRSPPTSAAGLMLHEAMAAFRKEMVAESESDEGSDDERPRPTAYGDDCPTSSPKARITAKFEMDSDRPGEMTATVTRESQQSDGSWKGKVRQESLKTVMNPFTGKPTTFSTPKLMSDLVKKTHAAPGIPKSWQTLPEEFLDDGYPPSSRPQRPKDQTDDTPSRPAKFPPPRKDSLNWQATTHRITKSRTSPKTSQHRTSPRRHSPPAPAPPSRNPPPIPTLSPTSPTRPIPIPSTSRRRPHSNSSLWSTTATVSFSPPTSRFTSPYSEDRALDRPIQKPTLHEKIRDAEHERLRWGGQAQGRAAMLRRLGKSPSELALETGRMWRRGEVEDLVGMPGGGLEFFGKRGKGKGREGREREREDS